jgi:RHS repeat-associated protein
MNLDSITRPSNLPVEPVAPVIQTVQRIHYYQNDQLGTPRELTNAEGEIAWSATYQAWGNTLKVHWAQESAAANERLQPTDLAANDPVHQPVRFQGQYFDAETGLHYNRFRYYDPDVGRFASQDPIGLSGGDNLYAYAPNPTGWVDTFGLTKTCKECDPCSKLAEALRSGPNGTTVSVETKAQAHDLLKEAFPDYQKVRGVGSQEPSGIRKKAKMDAFKMGGTYHKDYAIDPATGRVMGHSDSNQHGDCPHINIKRTDGKKVLINITGKKNVR